MPKNDRVLASDNSTTRLPAAIRNRGFVNVSYPAFLERRGLLVRDSERSFLTFDSTADEPAFDGLLGHSITYRIALGP